MDDTQDTLVDVNSPLVPPAVRAAVLRLMQPGDELWRAPALSAPRGLFGIFGFGPRSVVIEWWLIDSEGNLIEVFCEE